MLNFKWLTHLNIWGSIFSKAETGLEPRKGSHSMHLIHYIIFFAIFRQIDIPVSEKCKLFDTLVGSLLNYSPEICGIHDAKDIEVIHSKFCLVLNVKK